LNEYKKQLLKKANHFLQKRKKVSNHLLLQKEKGTIITLHFVGTKL